MKPRLISAISLVVTVYSSLEVIMKSKPEKPHHNLSEAALLKTLEIQWQDHFQTRTQTWKTLEISALLAVALVGIDWRIGNPLVTIVAASLLILVTQFGIQITLKHRKVEREKFLI